MKDEYLRYNSDKKTVCENKIEYLKNELLNKDKCLEFSKKICEYIRKNSEG